MQHAFVRRARVALVGLAAATAFAAPAFLAPLATPAAAVSYNSLPSITRQPVSVKAVINEHVDFEVKAKFASSYQWQMQAPGSSSWKNVAHGTKASIVEVFDSRTDSGTRLRVKITNNKGSVYSSPATLTVWGYDAKHAVRAGAIWESGDWIGLHDVTDTNAAPELKAQDPDYAPPTSGYAYIGTTVYVGNVGAKSATPWKTMDLGFVGNTGKVYGHCDDAFFDDDWYGTGAVKPGETEYGEFCAMVPKGEISGGTWVVLGDFQSRKANKNLIYVKQS